MFDLSQALSQDPFDFKTFETHVKQSTGIYAVLTPIYAGIAQIYAVTWECVFVCLLKHTFWILSGKHQGLLTTFLQQQAVTGLAKHFN